MSIGTSEYEEWAVVEIGDLADAIELHLRGVLSVAEIAGRVGRARAFLADEALFQARENQEGGWAVPYFTTEGAST